MDVRGLVLVLGSANGVVRTVNCLDAKGVLGHDHIEIRVARLRRGDGLKKMREEEEKMEGQRGEEPKKKRHRENPRVASAKSGMEK
jgi:hypothetical protein